jgi:hypothetical protein
MVVNEKFHNLKSSKHKIKHYLTKLQSSVPSTKGQNVRHLPKQCGDNIGVFQYALPTVKDSTLRCKEKAFQFNPVQTIIICSCLKPADRNGCSLMLVES